MRCKDRGIEARHITQAKHQLLTTCCTTVFLRRKVVTEQVIQNVLIMISFFFFNHFIYLLFIFLITEYVNCFVLVPRLTGARTYTCYAADFDKYPGHRGRIKDRGSRREETRMCQSVF